MVELIVTAINVFILMFILSYMVSDMAIGLLNGRKTRITEDIETAKLSKEEALALKKDYEHRLADFDSERNRILEDARQRAARAEERILLDGQEEADRLIARAHREAELKKRKLAEEVRSDMILTASRMAGRLTAAHISDAKQSAYIQEMLDEMGESTWQN